MKAPDGSLVRARAKAPLTDLHVLHLSHADLACLRNLESCRRLRSLYANVNVLKDLEGLLSLRCLWRIDLSDNRLRQLQPLASFPALGFLNLERNQLSYEDLVCLRDVHILDLRLTGNTGVLPADADRLMIIESRMKVVALLPSMWTLDGHYITIKERAQALEGCDDWVLRLLAQHSETTNSALRFGSTSEVWGSGQVSVDTSDLSTPVQEEALHLLQMLQKQPTRSTDQQELYRLRALATFYDTECEIHNAHIQFAPQKHTTTAKRMPNLRFHQLQQFSPRTRLEIGALLATHIDFSVPHKLLVESLTMVALQDGGNVDGIDDLASLPRYMLVACVSILRQQALDEHDKGLLSRHNQCFLTMWKAIPFVLPTLLQSEREAQLLDRSTPDVYFLQRCALVVSLLSRTTLFPSKITNHSDLAELVEAAKLAPTATLESLSLTIPTVLVSSNDLAKNKNLRPPEREYRKPWKERPQLTATASASDLMTTGSKSLTRRLPKAGEWLEVQPKLFFKIRSVSADGERLTASPATTTDLHRSTVMLRMGDVTRVSSSMWRVTTEDPQAHDEIVTLLRNTPNRLGRLHRAPEGFHKHGATRNQGYPNRDISTDDLRTVQCHEPQRLSAQPLPVEVFSATDTLDANYVLTSPSLISVQNAVASRVLQEQRRSPAGLWNPIETASFRITQPAADRLTEQTPPKIKKTIKLKIPCVPTERDMVTLQKDMQKLLGLDSPDVSCFVTAMATVLDEERRGDHPVAPSVRLFHSPSPLAPNLSEMSAITPHSITKPRKLAALSWHQVPTKPQLLVAAASPGPMAPPPQRSESSSSGDSAMDAATAEGTTDATAVPPACVSRPTSSRTPLHLTRCQVSLPSLPLVSQK